MRIASRHALQAAAWTAVSLIGLGALGELADARPAGSPAAVLAQAPGVSDATGPSGPTRPGRGPEAERDADDRGRGRPHARPGRRGGHRGPGMKGRVLHGEVTVKGRDDVVRVIVTQQGTITAASATSITVRSDDGHTARYALTDATIVRKGRQAASRSDLEVGDVVRVMGERTDTGVVTKRVHVRSADAETAAGGAADTDA